MDYLRYSVSPWLVRLEHALGRLLPAKAVRAVQHGRDAEGRHQDAGSDYTLALQNGILSLDEVRALEDLPPMPEGGETTTPSPIPGGNGQGTPGETQAVA